MNTKKLFAPLWSTASFGEAADTSPGELTALGEHMNNCHSLRGRLFTLQYGAEAVHRVLTARFVTTLTVVAALIGVATLLA